MLAVLLKTLRNAKRKELKHSDFPQRVFVKYFLEKFGMSLD